MSQCVESVFSIPACSFNTAEPSAENFNFLHRPTATRIGNLLRIADTRRSMLLLFFESHYQGVTYLAAQIYADHSGNTADCGNTRGFQLVVQYFIKEVCAT